MCQREGGTVLVLQGRDGGDSQGAKCCGPCGHEPFKRHISRVSRLSLAILVPGVFKQKWHSMDDILKFGFFLFCWRELPFL